MQKSIVNPKKGSYRKPGDRDSDGLQNLITKYLGEKGSRKKKGLKRGPRKKKDYPSSKKTISSWKTFARGRQNIAKEGEILIMERRATKKKREKDSGEKKKKSSCARIEEISPISFIFKFILKITGPI